ncbi:MAG: helix-turn-helix domain-containing protein [Leptolyngbyaceae cyanobacterium SM1_3_5]|nr:helix-turn-helix domain-containing protein [Leptolyngbyaceae cyanobacterium SM1_3_5]
MVILVAAESDKFAKERLAQLIKELRGRTTQREFAKLLGTSYTSIQDWEKQIRLPSENNLKRIAQLKGWTQEELLKYLFVQDASPEPAQVDRLETIIAQIEVLPLPQMQQLATYLDARLSQSNPANQKSMNRFLSENQKHNLHLLLRASIRNQSPTQAMAQVEIDPALFTDIFLRNDPNCLVSYEILEKLSILCCWVIRWRVAQLPEVDCDRTYQGEAKLLFKTLADGDKAAID